jgi:hypothetical protein
LKLSTRFVRLHLIHCPEYRDLPSSRVKIDSPYHLNYSGSDNKRALVLRIKLLVVSPIELRAIPLAPYRFASDPPIIRLDSGIGCLGRKGPGHALPRFSLVGGSFIGFVAYPSPSPWSILLLRSVLLLNFGYLSGKRKQAVSHIRDSP